MVRYRNNDYSAPVALAHHEVQVRGYVHEVVIGCGAEVIARHRRLCEMADRVFDPMHYLPLLKQTVDALGQAAPLKGWELPGEYRMFMSSLCTRRERLLSALIAEMCMVQQLGQFTRP
jgi:hypothetical protein